MDIIASILGYHMEWIFLLVRDYGWTIVVFTILVRLAMFPLNIKQQKSMARMSAFNPMMQEIQKKYANNKEKQQEELMKFQQENGVSMTAGCLPMIVQLVVMLGMYQVIYRPLEFILHVPKETIAAAVALVDGLSANVAGVQNLLIQAVQTSPSTFADVLGSKLDAVVAFDMDFLGLNLATMPEWARLVTLLLPILAVGTMIVSQLLVMRQSGQQNEQAGMMKWMPWIMSLSFGWFCFTVPVGFSLYYMVGNLLQMVQSFILKKMYDPQKMKQDIEAEIEARKQEKKKKKQITVVTETGDTLEKEVSESELARIRLAKARELDAKRYGD